MSTCGGLDRSHGMLSEDETRSLSGTQWGSELNGNGRQLLRLAPPGHRWPGESNTSTIDLEGGLVERVNCCGIVSSSDTERYCSSFSP